MPPLFSVVIPTYNQADYLRTAIQSVLNQTFQDFELVIVNNFSIDETINVAQNTGDERVKLINFANHGIIGASRNKGIENSTGRYVAFLDSDDIWYPNKLEIVASVIEDDPDIGLICHDQIQMREGQSDRRTVYGPPDDFDEDLYRFLLIISNTPSTSATTVARRYLGEVQMFSEKPEFATVEDYDLWLKLSKVCRFRFVHKILGGIRVHPGSSSTNVKVHLRNTLNVLDSHFSSLNRTGMTLSIRHRYAHAYNGAAREYQRQRSIKKALSCYVRAVSNYPFCLRPYTGLALLFMDTFIGTAMSAKLADVLWGLLNRRQTR